MGAITNSARATIQGIKNSISLANARMCLLSQSTSLLLNDILRRRFGSETLALTVRRKDCMVSMQTPSRSA